MRAAVQKSQQGEGAIGDGQATQLVGTALFERAQPQRTGIKKIRNSVSVL